MLEPGFEYAQGAIPGLLLLLASSTKVRTRSDKLDKTAVAEFLKTRVSDTAVFLRPLWRAIGLVELVAGFWLLSGFSARPAGASAAAEFGVGTAYLAWARRAHPEASCGCLGGDKPVSRRAVARAGLLASMATFYAATSPDVWTARRAWTVTPLWFVVLVEIVLLVWLSDELPYVFHRAILQAVGATRVAGDRLRGRSLARDRVEAQPFWPELVARAQGKPPTFVQSWREGRWFLLEYSSSWDGTRIAIVGADYLGITPPWIRIIVAEETEQGMNVFGVWDSAAYARSSRAFGPTGTPTPQPVGSTG
jgi:hypothetical protein